MLDSLVRETAKVLTGNTKETKPYDTVAEVVRVEGDTAWVHISGGIDETPVDKTINAKAGDQVNIRVSGGKAWITGNGSAPPTDDATAVKAQATATVAEATAVNAKEIAEGIEGLAVRAKEAADEAEQYASDASQSANDAEKAANDAQGSASLALNQLGIIENVVGVLDLLSKNGTYQETTDEEVVPEKWYFIQTGTSPDYVYEVVVDPSGDPSAQGWYELTGIDEAVQNYVSSHLILDNNGLWLQSDASNSRLFLSSTDGVILYGTGGTPVAKYGTDTLIGDYESEDGFYIKLDSTNNEIGFYNGTTKVAYMNSAQLYVSNSLSFGHFIFYERDNGHFTLKRVD